MRLPLQNDVGRVFVTIRRSLIIPAL